MTELLKFKDIRPEKTSKDDFSQFIPKELAARIIRSAISRGFDPYTALGMGMRETNMGTRGGNSYGNPLRFNFPVHFTPTYNSVDQEVNNIPKDIREYSEWYSGSQDPIDMAIDLAKYKLKKFGTLQAYQGTGDYSYNNPNTPAIKDYPAKVAAMAKIFRNMPEVQAMVGRGGRPVPESASESYNNPTIPEELKWWP